VASKLYGPHLTAPGAALPAPQQAMEAPGVIIPDHVPAAYRQISDDARRCADIVTLATIAGCTGMWVAIRLADGGYDGCIYDTREAAISHQLRPQLCTYVKVAPTHMPVYEAQALLDYWRELSTANVRDDDPAQPMPLMPLLAGDRRRQIRALKRGRR
jgi:hypothetical protein